MWNNVQRHHNDQKVHLPTAVRELECIIDGDLVNDHSNENLPCQLSQPLKTKNGRYLKTSFGCITCNVYTCKSGWCFRDYHARVCVRFERLLNKKLAWAWVSRRTKRANRATMSDQGQPDRWHRPKQRRQKRGSRRRGNMTRVEPLTGLVRYTIRISYNYYGVLNRIRSFYSYVCTVFDFGGFRIPVLSRSPSARLGLLWRVSRWSDALCRLNL